MPSLLFKCIPFIHPKPHPSPLSLVTAMSTKTKTRLRGVVFDMDGTLTVPVIDFSSMYKAVLGETEYRRIRQENPSGIDILHLIESWSPDEQRKANEIILDFERLGRERLQIMPGAAELCGFLDSKKIRFATECVLAWSIREVMIWSDRRGLITRNVKEAVDLYHQRFEIVFSPALSREFRPYKPDPAPLLHICSTWDVQPNEVMMVGDSLKDDVACGKRAGAFTCLLDEKGRYCSADFTELDLEPDFKVASLAEVHSLLETTFDLMP
ncbi:hypothetical protein POTOM_037591 [Populus tomentosa]|uniref:Haloacid dehalogenase-like hydrolase superfamily protein n=1 Tax=Populus tomentosa TaxID=118781 RepID=A0A8X8CKL6_POPTO|nr:hypothetical protein POTOM_037591 [Populus tomentosa]